MTEVPEAVRSALDGPPAAEQWESMLPLLTVEDAGFPHVCLLSRAELDADARCVYAVLASAVTIENLERDGRATLVAIDAEAAHYTKLRVERSIVDGDWLAVAFAVESVKRDGIGIPLRPAEYLVTESLAVQENWARSAELLARLRGA